jgi:redox-sensing transcriptional repressor
VSIGVIATPAAAAQKVCDRLVAAGVTSILNFAPVVLNVPSGVDVRKVDLSIELQILAFHAQRRNASAAPAGRSGEPELARRRRDRAPGRELGLAVTTEPGERPDIGVAGLADADLDFRTGAQAVGT